MQKNDTLSAARAELKSIASDCRALAKPQDSTSIDEQRCWGSIAKRVARAIRKLEKLK